MAVQKRRQSKARKNSRRAQWMKMAVPSLNACPHCGEARLPHRACPSCGQYGKKGEPLLIVPQKEKKSEEKSASK
jgi:large subunit ribosomal protein L32